MNLASTSEYKNGLKHSWVQAISDEPAEHVLKHIVRVLNRINGSDVVGIEEVIYSCVPLKILFLPDARILREKLPVDARVELYFRRSLKAETGDLVRETALVVAGASKEYRKRFWQEARKYIGYGDSLWNLAPDGIKNSIPAPPVKPKSKPVKLIPITEVNIRRGFEVYLALLE